MPSRHGPETEQGVEWYRRDPAGFMRENFPDIQPWQARIIQEMFEQVERGELLTVNRDRGRWMLTGRRPGRLTLNRALNALLAEK